MQSKKQSKKQHYRQLTQGQRYHIQALRQKGFSLRSIANDIGCHASSVCRELKRNPKPKVGYCAEHAEHLSRTRRSSALKHSKQQPEHRAILKAQFALKWSPEQVSLRLKREKPELAVSASTLYAWIEKDKRQGGDLYRQLPRFGKSRWRGGKRKAGKSVIPNRVDISKRPKPVENRKRLGDWEGDLITSQSGHLVTLVERRARLLLMTKVPSKEAKVVRAALIKLLKRVPPELRKTLTVDNGGEFAEHEQVALETGVSVYFAEPYASYQRGSNENRNGVIRRTWPKKTLFHEKTDEEIYHLDLQLNTTPMKVLNGLTPLESFTGKRVALIT